MRKFLSTSWHMVVDEPCLSLLMLIAFALRLFFWIYTDRTWEDALITALHSENFYQGLGLTHFNIQDPKPLHGFTSPISVLIPLAADFFHVGWGLVFQKIVSLLAGPLTVWFGYRIIFDHLVPGRIAPAILGAGYLAIEHHQILWGMAGMETQIASAILLASIYFLLCGQTIATGVTAGLCLLARPDFVIWVGIAACVVLYRAWSRRSVAEVLRFIVPVCLVYAPWLIFTTAYYGSPVPNTVIAKSLGYVGFWEHEVGPWRLLRDGVGVFIRGVASPLEPTFGGNGTGFVPLIPHYWLVELCVFLIAIDVVIDVARRRFAFLPLYVFAAAYATFLVFRAPVIFGWYVVPLCGLFAILLAKAVFDLTGLLPEPVSARAMWAAGVAYVLLFACFLPLTFRGERAIQQVVEARVRVQIGHYLASIPIDKTIACEPLGYIGYYSRRTTFDYPGLCSRKVVGWLRDHKYPRLWKNLQVFAYVRADYLVLRRAEYLLYHVRPDGKFIDAEYYPDREFKVPESETHALLHPEKNIDLDFIVFRRNDSGLPPTVDAAHVLSSPIAR